MKTDFAFLQHLKTLLCFSSTDEGELDKEDTVVEVTTSKVTGDVAKDADDVIEINAMPETEKPIEPTSHNIFDLQTGACSIWSSKA